MGQAVHAIGDQLREWRRRRRLSQLDLAGEAEISTRHLSFLETGRAQPSRAMVLHLAERLDVPLRERNMMLTAAGYAAMFSERSLGDPALAAAREAIDLILKGHEPYPALAIDRHWTMIASNNAVAPLLAGVDGTLIKPPVNVLRLSLHPQGLAPRVVNLAEWRAHLLARLRHQIDVSADPALVALMKELAGYPAPRATSRVRGVDDPGYAGVVVPLKLMSEAGTLAFFSTTTVFGTPIDITLSELALEAFYPADAPTAEALRRIGSG